MHVESPWLVILLLPIAALVAWRSRSLEPAGRWLVRVATLLLALACVGLQVRCDREMRIVAMVDVSPSTRGAAFRDSQSVEAKLKQLVPGRRVDVRYFADGRVTTSNESASTQTRLPETDADAIVLMSDGRLATPDVLPPVFAVVDPSLDAIADARITAMEINDASVRVSTYSPTTNGTLRLSEGSKSTSVPAGPSTMTIASEASSLTATLDPLDAWPENNVLSAIAAPATDATPWIITDASQLPTDPAAYLAPASIVIPAGIELSSVQTQRLTQYARDLGGSLVIVGSPRTIAPGLRSISPLTGFPPRPESEWMILLDASGSMASGARGDSRWDRATGAAIDAVERLDESQRVSVAIFAQSAETVAGAVPPAEAIARLRSLANRVPHGSTGLSSALRSVAARTSTSPTQLLLITDADASIDAPDEIIEQLTRANVRVFVLATGVLAPDAALRRIVERTEGALIEESDAKQWSGAMRSLLDSASGDEVIAPAAVATEGSLAGVRFEAERLFRAFARAKVEPLASTTRGEAVAATWQVGLGRVTVVAAEMRSDALTAIADRLRRAPADPRFALSWDLDRVVLSATDTSGAMNGLSPMLVGDATREAFVQVVPGRYEAAIARSASAKILNVIVENAVVASRAIPGRYAAEFDVIGNDRASLEALARRTGGMVIDATNSRPIDLPRASEWHSLSVVLAAFGMLMLGAAVVFIRAPYLADRLVRYARRSVR